MEREVFHDIRHLQRESRVARALKEEGDVWIRLVIGVTAG